MARVTGLSANMSVLRRFVGPPPTAKCADELEETLSCDCICLLNLNFKSYYSFNEIQAFEFKFNKRRSS